MRDDGLLTEAPAPSRGAAARLYAGGVAVVLAVLAFAVGSAWLRRAAVAAERETRAAVADAGIRVLAARATLSPGRRAVTLPGDVRAFRQVTLYAKISGYLREIRVDKGDQVAAGQVLGVLESPETDQQILAAAADLANKAQLEERYRALVAKGVVSQQEMDKAHADLVSARAESARLDFLKGYETVRAPFAGVVTARYVDPGALLPAATGATQSAQPLVDLADMKHLRIYVYLGQNEAPFVHEGDAVRLRGDDQSGIDMAAKLTRMAHALDPRTRTMLAEIDIDNADGRIYPGLFVRVALDVQSPAGLVVPADAVVLRAGQPLVARIEANRAHFVPVRLGNDNGRTVHVISGLAEGDVVGLHVGDELSDGAAVQAILPP